MHDDNSSDSIFSKYSSFLRFFVLKLNFIKRDLPGKKNHRQNDALDPEPVYDPPERVDRRDHAR